MRDPPVSRCFPRWARLSARRRRVASMCPWHTAPRLKGDVETACVRPDSRRLLTALTASPHLTRHGPDRAVSRVRVLTVPPRQPAAHLTSHATPHARSRQAELGQAMGHARCAGQAGLRARASQAGHAGTVHWAAADSAEWHLIYILYFLNIFKSLQIQKFV
jgi:hypothetical protein